MGKRSRRKALRRKVTVQPAPPANETSVPDEQDLRLHQLELQHTTLIAEMDRHIYREAYKMFLTEGGDAIDLMLENGQLTMAAYRSQIRAAKEGGSGWGPTVTPYEDRMTRSLQMRLMRQKQEWIERCRQRILEERKAYEDQRAAAGESEPEEEELPEEATPTPEEFEFGGTDEPAPETEAAHEPALSSTSSP